MILFHLGLFKPVQLGAVNIIQIWTCDEGNMEFYGSEATILT